MFVIKRNGKAEPLSVEKIHRATGWACDGLDVSQSELETEAHLMLFEGIKTSDIQNALIKAASTLISVEKPQYTFVAARLLLQNVMKTVAGGNDYPHIRSYIERGVVEKRLDPALLTFDLEVINAAIEQSRDLNFTYLGLQTVVDRYLIRETVANTKSEGEIIELPQHFFMRVAMGLALNEDNREQRAIDFYEILSTFEFMSSTPTLFNAGTLRPQLSSCYLNTVADCIVSDDKDNRAASIFGTIEECANLSKFSGGIGTDWTRVRPAGDTILGTNGKSSGIVPYLKVFNDTAVAVNQGGKRNGAFAAYLEPWHPDFDAFCDLKKNSGDERRRAHDIFPAAWVPDLLMKRVKAKGVWSFFSPAEFPELHELFGDDFEKRYEELEAQGKYRFQKPAADVWKRMITSLFETGHPWITFKDECNRRNPQDHVGVIHNSNLCTEITLNTSDDETAVCNLGSVNLARMTTPERLEFVVTTGVRMLDNVIDINFYPSERSRNSNLRHRPIGLGIMGESEAIAKLGIKWDSEEHVTFCDQIMELISWHAIRASVKLSRERGSYESFVGSKWNRGILPIDTARDQTKYLSEDAWDALRHDAMGGMRNSNLMAIAPTATISNITGTTPCIEPAFDLVFTKSNLSGSFKVVDSSLNFMKLEDAKDAFGIEPHWLIRCAAKRQKWMDQSQSLNIYARNGIKGSELSDVYFLAWELGCKTTYYLRGKSKKVNTVGETAVVESPKVESAGIVEEPVNNLCSLDNPECESCQ